MLGVYSATAVTEQGPYWTAEQAAGYISADKQRIYDLRSQGRLRCVKNGSHCKGDTVAPLACLAPLAKLGASPVLWRYLSHLVLLTAEADQGVIFTHVLPFRVFT